MEPHVIDELKFSESNSEDHIVIFANDPNYGPENFNLQVGFVRKDDVIALRDWLNRWLDLHVFVVPPRV